MFINIMHFTSSSLGLITRITIISVIAFVMLLTSAETAKAQRVWVQQGPGPNTLGQVEVNLPLSR